jgi:hypothetical protein
MKITRKHFVIKIGPIDIYRCPKCHKNDIKEHYNYCPHCGINLTFDFKETEYVKV